MPVIILQWKNWLEKVHRIYENDAQNLQVMRAEFAIFCFRILTTLYITSTSNGCLFLEMRKRWDSDIAKLRTFYND